jgi:hypothetical protein
MNWTMPGGGKGISVASEVWTDRDRRNVNGLEELDNIGLIDKRNLA